MSAKRKVFVSHSSKDKPLVRKIVAALEANNVAVWFDERELGVGDSIVKGISEGLEDSDYLLAVLSKNSVPSKWVQNELNASLMEETSNRGILVLPAVIEDCDVPMLLRDRIYADFRKDFDAGIEGLLRVFAQEGETAAEAMPAHAGTMGALTCETVLSSLSLAELRQRIRKLRREQLVGVWCDVFETSMNDEMHMRTPIECVVELLIRAKSENKLAIVIASVCAERPDLANP